MDGEFASVDYKNEAIGAFINSFEQAIPSTQGVDNFVASKLINHYYKLWLPVWKEYTGKQNVEEFETKKLGESVQMSHCGFIDKRGDWQFYGFATPPSKSQGRGSAAKMHQQYYDMIWKPGKSINDLRTAIAARARAGINSEEVIV